MNGPTPYSSVPVWISNKIGAHLAAAGLANELMADAVEIDANARTRRFVLTHKAALRLVAVLKQADIGGAAGMRAALRNLAARAAAGLKDAEVRQRLQVARLPIEIYHTDRFTRFMGSAPQIEAAGFSLLEGQAWPVRGKWWQFSAGISHRVGVTTTVEVGGEPWPELYRFDLENHERLLLEPAPERTKRKVVAMGGNVFSLAQWRSARAGGHADSVGAP